jgi:hypothetical protein
MSPAVLPVGGGSGLRWRGGFGGSSLLEGFGGSSLFEAAAVFGGSSLFESFGGSSLSEGFGGSSLFEGAPVFGDSPFCKSTAVAGPSTASPASAAHEVAQRETRGRGPRFCGLPISRNRRFCRLCRWRSRAHKCGRFPNCLNGVRVHCRKVERGRVVGLSGVRLICETVHEVVERESAACLSGSVDRDCGINRPKTGA